MERKKKPKCIAKRKARKGYQMHRVFLYELIGLNINIVFWVTESLTRDSEVSMERR